MPRQTLVLAIAAMTLCVAGVGLARQPATRPEREGAAMERYQIDIACGAAVDVWLGAISHDTAIEARGEAWAVSALYSQRLQASAQALGYTQRQVQAALLGFEAWAPHELRSADPATAEKARQGLAGTLHACLALAASDAVPGATTIP